MLIPSRKLLLWFFVVVIPFVFLWSLFPAMQIGAVAVVVLFFCFVVIDALLSRKESTSYEASIEPLTRAQKNRAFQFPIRISNRRGVKSLIKIGLPWPEDFTTPQKEMLLALPAGFEVAEYLWECTPCERGNYHIGKCYIGTSSPLGFWETRTTQPLNGEIRVYPDLLSETRNVSALFLNRGSHGIHARRLIGAGRDFEKLREYIPGDSYDQIHWKASAKRGHPMTKIFQAEKTQEVYVILDCSRLSARECVTGNSLPVTTLERFITATLLLALAAQQQGDLFGLVAFDEKIRSFLKAKSGKAHFNTCRENLYNIEPSDGTPDYEELFSFIRTRIRKRALLVFLTALDDPVLAEKFTTNIQIISNQHLIFVNMLNPEIAKPLFEKRVTTLDEIYSQLAGHNLWNRLRTTGKHLHQHGVGMHLLENERLTHEIVSQYLDVKSRQIL